MIQSDQFPEIPWRVWDAFRVSRVSRGWRSISPQKPLPTTFAFLLNRSASHNPPPQKMALLQYHAPVDYAAQLDGFKDFLKHFKTMQSTDEAAATEALESLNIDGNRTSDEYDMMDDVEGGAQTRSARKQRQVKLKYMDILLDVANRDSTHILIELDDLETVRLPPLS